MSQWCLVSQRTVYHGSNADIQNHKFAFPYAFAFRFYVKIHKFSTLLRFNSCSKDVCEGQSNIYRYTAMSKIAKESVVTTLPVESLTQSPEWVSLGRNGSEIELR